MGQGCRGSSAAQAQGFKGATALGQGVGLASLHLLPFGGLLAGNPWAVCVYCIYDSYLHPPTSTFDLNEMKPKWNQHSFDKGLVEWFLMQHEPYSSRVALFSVDGTLVTKSRSPLACWPCKSQESRSHGRL